MNIWTLNSLFILFYLESVYCVADPRVQFQVQNQTIFADRTHFRNQYNLFLDNSRMHILDKYISNPTALQVSETAEPKGTQTLPFIWWNIKSNKKFNVFDVFYNFGENWEETNWFLFGYLIESDSQYLHVKNYVS